MSKTPTRSRRRTFHSHNVKTSFGMVRLAEQVRLAMPIAQRFIEEGIDYGQRGNDSFMTTVVKFLGDPEFAHFYKHASEEDAEAWADRLEAARAIGIALGLMLRPEAFGGVR